MLHITLKTINNKQIPAENGIQNVHEYAEYLQRENLEQAGKRVFNTILKDVKLDRELAGKKDCIIAHIEKCGKQARQQTTKSVDEECERELEEEKEQEKEQEVEEQNVNPNIEQKWDYSSVLQCTDLTKLPISTKIF